MTEPDITHLKIKDIYTNRILPVRTPEELGDWIREATATKSGALERTIGGLVEALNNGEDYKWHGAANGLEITEKTKRRRRK